MIVKIMNRKTKKVIDKGLYFNRTLNHIQLGDSIGYGECFAWRKHDIREVDYVSMTVIKCIKMAVK